jgi:hypothetical protein
MTINRQPVSTACAAASCCRAVGQWLGFKGHSLRLRTALRSCAATENGGGQVSRPLRKSCSTFKVPSGSRYACSQTSSQRQQLGNASQSSWVQVPACSTLPARVLVPNALDKTLATNCSDRQAPRRLRTVSIGTPRHFSSPSCDAVLWYRGRTPCHVESS